MLQKIPSIIFTRATLVLILFLCCQPAEAQQYNFTFFGVEDGLAGSNVKDIHQDQYGYLWIATHSGVSKFDGKVFKNWGKENGMLNGITSQLVESNKGEILVGSKEGLSLFKDDILTVFDTTDGLPSMYISSLYNGPEGKVWLATSKGLAYYKDGKIWEPKFNLPRAKMHCRGMAGGGKYPFYVQSAHTVYYLENGKWDSLPNYNLDVVDMIMDQDGGLWMGCWPTNHLTYWKNGELKYYNDIITSPVTNLYEDKQGRIWVATWDEGMYCIEKGRIRNYSSSNGLNSTSYWAVSQDDEGNIWFGSFGGGLVKFPQDPFVHYNKADGLNSNVINALMVDSKRNIWVGTDNGLLCGKLLWNDKIEWRTNSWNDFFIGKKIVAFHELDKGDIAVGCYGPDTRLAIIKDDKVVSYHDRIGSSAFNIKQNKKGELIVGTDSHGLLVSGTQGDSIIKFKDGFNRIVNLTFDTHDRLWISRYDGGVGIWEEDSIYLFNEGFLAHASVANCEVGFNGEMWIAVEQKGIWMAEYENGQLNLLDSFNIKNGAISNNIISIRKDSQGKIWIGTDLGVMIVKNYQDGEILFDAYTKTEGFNQGNCSFNALAQLGNKMFIGTSGGLTAMDVDWTPKVFRLDKMKFVDLQLHYQSVGDQYISSTDQYGFPDQLEFTYDENHLTFEVRAIHFTYPEKVRYRFWMEGLDNDWSPLMKEGKITYSSLPPGSYTLHIESLLKDEKDGVRRLIQIQINPPFWQTVWFLISVSAFAVLIVILIFRWRTNKLRRDRQKLEETVEERTNELRIQKEVVEEKNQEITDSIVYAQRIQSAILPPSKLVRSHLPESFVLYLPKDIVAGDFYWLEQTDEAIYIAAADCTGHGVPGAMVSVVCHVALNRSVKEFGKTSPAEILDKTRELVIETFERSEHDVKDGMDIALVKIYKRDSQKIDFAGAQNPLWLIRDGEIIEWKGDKQPIGAFENAAPFTNNEVSIQEGDIFYIFSDGFVDQFGGEKGKKFKASNFKKFLMSIYQHPTDQQHEALKNQLKVWKGDLEQLDDICVIGVRL